MDAPVAAPLIVKTVDSVTVPLVAARVTCALLEMARRKLSATEIPVTGSVPACFTAAAGEERVMAGAPTIVSNTLCEEVWAVPEELLPRSRTAMLRATLPVAPLAGA